MDLVSMTKYTLSGISTYLNSLSKSQLYVAESLTLDALSSQGNPILTAQDVTDYGFVSFVADPFLYIAEDAWHLFFEVQNGYRDPTAVIGHATSEDRGDTWEYDQISLKWDRHLAFPFVFEANNSIYMVPGQGGDPGERPVTLFKAATFPNEWKPVVDLLRPNYGPLDPVIIRHEDYWWVIVGSGNNDTLYAYYSDELESNNWKPHAENPIVTDRVYAGRPAGRPLSTNAGPVLFLQDNTQQYGDKVRGYKITKLTPTEYADEPIGNQPLFEGTGMFGWNSSRMHHIDIHYIDDDDVMVCITDGDVRFGRSLTGACWSIGGYTLEQCPILEL